MKDWLMNYECVCGPLFRSRQKLIEKKATKSDVDDQNLRNCALCRKEKDSRGGGFGNLKNFCELSVPEINQKTK